MFSFFANAFGYVLNAIYEIVNNYGIAIIIFTVLLKLVMLPISVKQQVTMKKTSKVQGKVKEIQEKYKSDPVRLNQEVMAAYKEEGASPFSGCLSSIIQFIIILSIFFLVSRPLTYMKHIEPEIIDKYTQELQEESKNMNYKEIAIIKEKSAEDENVRINMDFLTLDLSDVASQNYTNWKVFIIPVMYVITSIFSMRLTMSMTKKLKEKNATQIVVTGEENKDNKQADAMEEMNKNMMLMMPVMSVMIALIAPLGLALYWLVSNLLMIGERLIINKYMDSKEAKNEQ